MKKKDVLKLLIQHLTPGEKNKIVIHSKFLKELQELLEDASGCEKDILNLLVRQLGYLRDFEKRVNEVDGNEKLKHTTRDYYSLHGKGFNIRLLLGFLSENRPVFLVAFFERSGKKISDYSRYIDVLDERYSQMESEDDDE